MGSFRCLAIVAALVALVFECAHGAPAGARTKRHLDYSAGRTLATQLNEKARYLYREVEIPNELAVVSDPPLMIRPEDKCDPDSLQSNAEPCLSKVILALKNYSRIFGDNGLFREEYTKCSKWRASATDVFNVTTQLLHALKEKVEAQEPLKLEKWMSEGFLCRDSVDRLYSFSILTARIFNFLSHQHNEG
ncbi:hypothetical protein MHYP_G00079720 [Metynnis hypsauchen]